jgi:hypothetical protein
MCLELCATRYSNVKILAMNSLPANSSLKYSRAAAYFQNLNTPYDCLSWPAKKLLLACGAGASVKPGFSLRSRRKHKAWGGASLLAEPQELEAMEFRAHEMGGSLALQILF